MSNAPRIVVRPNPGITGKQARDVRARAWAYLFDCFNRRNGKEGGPTTAPDEGERSLDEFASTTNPTKPAGRARPGA